MQPFVRFDYHASMADDPLRSAIWTALTTSHAFLAVKHGQACRYPAAIAPFAAVEEPTPAALDDLAQLLQPGESTYLLRDHPPDSPLLRWDTVVPCLQMAFPEGAPLPTGSPGTPHIEPLTCRNAPEMLDLIAVAFPGYFRPETCRMGRYFGIRSTGGTLIAMGGERLVFHPWREISGLCSHPSHPGQGLGSAILRHLLALHRSEGSRSWLWVVDSNLRAIDLYLRLGFEILGRSHLHRVSRTSASGTDAAPDSSAIAPEPVSPRTQP